MATPTKKIILKPSRMRYAALAFSLALVAVIILLYQQHRSGWLLVFLIAVVIVIALPALLSGNIILEDGRLTRTTWFGYTRQAIYVKDIEAFFEVSGYSRHQGLVFDLFLITPNGRFIIQSIVYPEYSELKPYLIGHLREATDLKRRFLWRQFQTLAFLSLACAGAIFCWLFLWPEYQTETPFLYLGAFLLVAGFTILPVNAYMHGNWNSKR